MSLRAMSPFKQSAGGKIVNAVKLVNGFILLETILSSTDWIYCETTHWGDIPI